MLSLYFVRFQIFGWFIFSFDKTLKDLHHIKTNKEFHLSDYIYQTTMMYTTTYICLIFASNWLHRRCKGGFSSLQRFSYGPILLYWAWCSSNKFWKCLLHSTWRDFRSKKYASWKDNSEQKKIYFFLLFSFLRQNRTL